MIQSCDGCNKSGFCDFQMNGTTEECPCYDCIIKMMCSEICEGFGDFHNKIFRFPPRKFLDFKEKL